MPFPNSESEEGSSSNSNSNIVMIPPIDDDENDQDGGSDETCSSSTVAHDNDDDEAPPNTDRMVDITEVVTVHGIASLTPTEPYLCQSELFSLHDAMAASQLVDKKMDSCQVPAHLAAPLMNTHTRPRKKKDDDGTSKDSNDDEIDDKIDDKTSNKVLFPRPPPTGGLDDPFLPLPWNDLTLPQASAVLLQMMMRGQALLCGASVGESTFTCLYVHAPVLSDMQQRVTQRIRQHDVLNQETPSSSNDEEENDLVKRFEQLLLSTSCTNGSSKPTTNGDSSSTVTSLHSSSHFLAQFVVFAMSYTLLDLTELFRGIVMNADIYEEEDFVSTTHGIAFYAGIKEGMSEQYVTMALKLLQAHKDNTSMMNKNDAETIHAMTTIHLVLQSMIRLHSLMFHLSKVTGPVANIRQTVTTMQRVAIQLSKGLRTLQQEIRDHDKRQASDDDGQKTITVLQQSFDSYVNRPLLGNAPVRTVQFLSPFDATSELITIAEELDWAVCRLLLHGTSLGRVERMLDRVSSPSCSSSSVSTTSSNNSTPTIHAQHQHQRRQGINILSRSLIVLNLYFDDKLLGRLDVGPLLGQHLEQWQHVPACYKDNWPRNEDANGDAQQRQQEATGVVSASSMSTEGSSGGSMTQQQVEPDPAQAFFIRLAKPVYDTLKLRTSNRNRQRAYLEGVIFRDWTALQHEASMIDVHYFNVFQQQQQNQNQPRTFYNKKDPTMPLTTSQAQQQPPPNCFGHYVLGTLIRLMDRHLSCGIQLGLLYGHDELCAAFWYRDFLLAALLQNLSTMRQSKLEARRQQLVETSSSPGASSSHPAKGGKGVKKKNPKHHHKSNGKHSKKSATGTTPASMPVTEEELEDECEIQLLELKRMLCRGLVRFIVALRKAGLLTVQEYSFTSLERMFCKRFEVFQSIRHPPALTYGDYLEGSDASRVSPTEVVQSTVEVFASAKAAVERILAEFYQDKSPKRIDPMYTPVPEEDVRGLLKVCVGNSVYLMRLQQLLRSPSSTSTAADKRVKVKVDFDFETSREFCIVKLS